MSERTVNIRLRNSLAESLRERVKERDHPSLNAYVNEICRSYLHSEGGRPVGLLDLLDTELGPTVDTEQAWILLLDTGTQPYGGAPIMPGARVIVDCLTEISPTTLTTRHNGVLPRVKLVAWLPVRITDADHHIATLEQHVFDAGKTPFGNPVEPVEYRPGFHAILAACRRFGAYPLGYELPLNLGAAIQHLHIHAQAADVPRILLPIHWEQQDRRFLSGGGSEVPSGLSRRHFRLLGIRITSPVPGTLVEFSIGGGANLVPRTDPGFEIVPQPFSAGTTDIETLVDHPILAYPNTVTSVALALSSDLSPQEAPQASALLVPTELDDQGHWTIG